MELEKCFSNKSNNETGVGHAPKRKKGEIPLGSIYYVQDCKPFERDQFQCKSNAVHH